MMIPVHGHVSVHAHFEVFFVCASFFYVQKYECKWVHVQRWTFSGENKIEAKGNINA